MPTLTCPKCGWINFDTARNCKKCITSLIQTQSGASFGEDRLKDVRRGKSISPLKILLIVLVMLVPGWYYYQSLEKERVAQEQKQKEGEKEYAKQKEEKRRRCLSEATKYTAIYCD